MNILIATDSYKGCLTSLQAGNAMKEGVLQMLPEAVVKVLPVSDGGEGMLEAFAEVEGGRLIKVSAHDALKRPMETAYAFCEDTKTAYIETARTAGLTLLRKEERNPLLTTTFGVGETVAAALARGAQRIVVGLGGSATNDGGTGMAEALGFRFWDAKGKAVSGYGKNLERIVRMEDTDVNDQLRQATFTAACDVKAPFCGPQGAVEVFARQKGADETAVKCLESGMHHFGAVLSNYCGYAVTSCPGSGAAGGLGGAMMALMEAEMTSGIALLLHTPQFQTALEGATLILTGEGCLDAQTEMGKAAWGILQEGRKRNVPVLAIAGKVVHEEAALQMGFSAIESATPESQTLTFAMQPDIAYQNISQAVVRILRHWMKEKRLLW